MALYSCKTNSISFHASRFVCRTTSQHSAPNIDNARLTRWTVISLGPRVCAQAVNERKKLTDYVDLIEDCRMNTANKALQRRRQTIIRWVKVSAGYYHCRSATPLVVINRLTCGPKRHVCGSLYRGLSAVASTDDYSKNASAVATTDVSGTTLPIIPIEFDIAAKIEGQESHIATIQLHPGETLRTESGAMLYMTDGVESMLSRPMAAFIILLTGILCFI